MVKKWFSINVDKAIPLVNELFTVVDGDTGVGLHISLTEQGAPVDISGARIVLKFEKGEKVVAQDSMYSDGGVTIVDGPNGLIDVVLYNGSFSVGTISCEIVLFSGEDFDVSITSGGFNFRCVARAVDDDAIINHHDYNVLQALIKQCQEMIARDQVDWAVDDPVSAQYIKHKPSAFAPSAHAASHSTDSTDPINPADIGAAADTHSIEHSVDGSDRISLTSLGIIAGTETVTTTDWVDSAVEIEIEGSADKTVFVSPSVGSYSDWNYCAIYVSEQIGDVITLSCSVVPDSDIVFNYLIVGD